MPLIIKDPALGKYSIEVTYKSYVVCTNNNTHQSFGDLNSALKNIASRLVADTEGYYTLAQFTALEAVTYENIKNAVELMNYAVPPEMEDMPAEQEKQQEVTEEKVAEGDITTK